MSRFDDIFHETEAGQFRTNATHFGWRGATGMITYTSAAVQAGEWRNGRLRLRCEPEEGPTETLILTGFKPEDYKVLQQHFMENCNIEIKIRASRIDTGSQVESGSGFYGSSLHAAPEPRGEVPELLWANSSILQHNAATSSFRPTSGHQPGEANLPVCSLRSVRGGEPDPNDRISLQHPNFIKADLVWKKSRLLKQWRRRWVVLTPESLLTFKTREEGKPTETMAAPHITNVGDADLQVQRVCAFYVRFGRRCIYMVADTPLERDSWVGEISRALVSR
eukprot:NODE_7477_length_1575_cov_3.232044.p1 GENE.NODE_7477_length_1575_cov_3.232044~~NODE_7477_length_1575_cov_3.232044.p1  ORF type:complete len:324 (+),score=41.25 NODE_7477_length_1575_cov_3.232044:136-972(+)